MSSTITEQQKIDDFMENVRAKLAAHIGYNEATFELSNNELIVDFKDSSKNKGYYFVHVLNKHSNTQYRLKCITHVKVGDSSAAKIRQTWLLVSASLQLENIVDRLKAELQTMLDVINEDYDYQEVNQSWQ